MERYDSKSCQLLKKKIAEEDSIKERHRLINRYLGQRIALVESVIAKEFPDDVSYEEIDDFNLINIFPFYDENGNVDNYLFNKFKYEDCISKLRIGRDCKVEGYKCDLFTAFQKLLICRNAYWKIAGEEMGLGKPWKPDWSNKNELKYCIENSYDKGIHYDVLVHTQKTLAFPTYEMRDAFYENFEELIIICKKLL